MQSENPVVCSMHVLPVIPHCLSLQLKGHPLNRARKKHDTSGGKSNENLLILVRFILVIAAVYC